MNQIDERPKRKNKKKRGTRGMNIQDPDQDSLAQQQTVNEFNQQLEMEQMHQENQPKKRAGTTGQPG